MHACAIINTLGLRVRVRGENSYHNLDFTSAKMTMRWLKSFWRLKISPKIQLNCDIILSKYKRIKLYHIKVFCIEMIHIDLYFTVQ
jgi:hypothetical protein